MSPGAAFIRITVPITAAFAAHWFPFEVIALLLGVIINHVSKLKRNIENE